MKAVIVKAKSQIKVVDCLVDYIKKLDGTDVVVIPSCEETSEYPDRNNFALREAADYMAGEPFFWLEPDAIPLKAGWLKEAEKEYFCSGKEFMISSDENPPHDMVGGIGIYGPSTRWLIPKHIDGNFKGQGWDGWMIKSIPHTIHRTPLIQHSYGLYHMGQVETHRFPRDIEMIREKSIIFHRDKYQDLINIKNLK
jgi:hypothetical protein